MDNKPLTVLDYRLEHNGFCRGLVHAIMTAVSICKEMSRPFAINLWCFERKRSYYIGLVRKTEGGTSSN